PQYETVLTTKDGTSYPIEFSTRLIEYAGRPATSVLVRDITERKKAEEELRHREQRFRALIENAQDAIVILSGDGIIRYESPSMARVLGHNPEDRIGKNPFDVVHPDDVPAAADLFAQVLRTSGDRVNTEVRVQHEDGSWRTVEVVAHNLLDDLAVAGVVVNIRDITERKQAEETLREGEEHYSALAENLSDAVFHLRDGIVVWCNDKVNQIYGYTKDELIGKDISFFQPYETDHLRFINEGYAMIKERGHFRGTTRSKAKDGGMVDIEYSIAKIPGRYPIELVAVARNVTERKRMEEQLHVAGRLAAVGELAAGVAHELNNPLTAVQAFAEFLAEKQDLDDTTKDDIQTIYQEAQRAARITSNLLSFARKRKPEKHFISISEALDKSLELHSYRLKVNNIEVVRQLHPSLPWT
ncbi:MAG: PAS domain S-box protein, partial [Dehalococcoidia bacterium]|nr:PAS domain S-box protein [Dehalococcoidia bacterium]